MRQEVRLWEAFNKYWIEKSKEIPVLFFRFEDLIGKPQETMGKILSFLLKVDNIKGTIIEKRINDYYAGQSKSKRESYKPREGGKQGGALKNRHRVTDEQFKYIAETAKSMIAMFGYNEIYGIDEKPAKTWEEVNSEATTAPKQMLMNDKSYFHRKDLDGSLMPFLPLCLKVDVKE